MRKNTRRVQFDTINEVDAMPFQIGGVETKIKPVLTTRLSTVLTILVTLSILAFMAGCSSPATTEEVPADSSSTANGADTKASEESSEPETVEIETGESLVGTWECITESGSVEKFIFILTFSEQNKVTYVAGWYQSEIAESFTGSFAVENGNALKLTMTNDNDSSTMDSAFLFDVLDDRLTLTLQGGDSLTYLFGIGEAMEFNKVVQK
ncbi:MAG: hypothetical protein FWG24_05110 [Eggerthellaceae bacterium]|nr:hypothetical protein [Eggerthellaceae bacterium]